MPRLARIMLRRPVLLGAAAAAALGAVAVACGGGSSASTSTATPELGTRYASSALGFSATYAHGEPTEEAGGQRTVRTAEVTLDGATHRVTIDSLDLPATSADEDVDVVTDETTGDRRTIRSDQEGQRMRLSAGPQSLVVEVNPDGSYRVGGQPAEDARAAAELAVSSPVVSEASLHGLAALDGLLQLASQLESTRMSQVANEGGGSAAIGPDLLHVLEQVVAIRRGS